MQLILALLAVWFVVRPRGSEVAVSSAPAPVGIVPQEGVTVADPVATAAALERYTPNTPIVWSDGNVTRETTTGQLSQDLRAFALMDDAQFLPVEYVEPRHYPATNIPFAV